MTGLTKIIFQHSSDLRKTATAKSGEFRQTCWRVLLTILMLRWQESISSVGLGLNNLSIRITRVDEEKLDSSQMPLPAKTFSGTSPLEKLCKKISSTERNMSFQNYMIVCGPSCITYNCKLIQRHKVVQALLVIQQTSNSIAFT